MVKASALHLTLVIVLVITILLGSMIYIHFFYRDQQQKTDRWLLLEREMKSSTTLSLSSYFPFTAADSLMQSPISIEDSISIGKQRWGFLNLIRIHYWRQADSLKRSFFTGETMQDSTVLYIADEDRSLSISGKTVLQGMAFLPKSGIRPAYVDGEYYQGKESMVDGQIKQSNRKFPEYTTEYIKEIHRLYGQLHDHQQIDHLKSSVLKQSFLSPTQYITTNNTLNLDSVIGNLVILSDTTITLSKHTYVADVLIIAPHIKVEDGFTGSGQFFALDSMTVGKNVQLNYPSILGVLPQDNNESIAMLNVGDNSKIEGLLIIHRPRNPGSKDIINLGKDVKIQGQVITFGLLKYSPPLAIAGSLHAHRLITQTPNSLYENYLINLSIERGKLHPYYIRPYFWTTDKRVTQSVVKWLN